jgi:hypothetical protein
LKNKFTDDQIAMLSDEEQTKAKAFNDAFDKFHQTTPDPRLLLSGQDNTNPRL